MRRVVSAALGLVLLAGCGVRPTRPVGGGEAPRGLAAGPTLYFLRDGRPAPVVRKTGKLGDYESAMQELFAGLRPEEAAPGLATALPRSGYGQLSAGLTQRNTVEAQLLSTSGRPLALSDLALDQVACTLAARYLAAGQVFGVETVYVNQAPRRCPVNLD